MTAFIQAPYPAPRLIITLPSPELGNGFQPESRVNVKRSMLGDVTTYVNSSARQTVTLTWELTVMKALELKEFIKQFPGSDWQLTLHDGTNWSVKLKDSDFAKRSEGRRDKTGVQAGSEFDTVTLTFSAESLD